MALNFAADLEGNLGQKFKTYVCFAKNWGHIIFYF